MNKLNSIKERDKMQVESIIIALGLFSIFKEIELITSLLYAHRYDMFILAIVFWVIALVVVGIKYKDEGEW